MPAPGEQLELWGSGDGSGPSAAGGSGRGADGAAAPADADASPGAANGTPVINIISDSIGDSAANMAIAAASQFSDGNCLINRLPNVTSLSQMQPFIERHMAEATGDMILFHTIADEQLRAELEYYLLDKNVAAVDLIGPAIDAIALATGRIPRGEPGLNRETDDAYYNRIEAIEFAVEHDDGRNPESLAEADIVLIGVSRSSKTPLSIYMAMMGYKLANVPLTPGSTPPRQLFELDRRRVFGLTTDPTLLAKIRQRRLGNATGVAASYANIDAVMDDLEQARLVMRRIGCMIVRTDNRAIEEVAQEILRLYHTHFPR